MQTRKELSLPTMNSYGESNISSEIYISALRAQLPFRLRVLSSTLYLMTNWK